MLRSRKFWKVWVEVGNSDWLDISPPTPQPWCQWSLITSGPLCVGLWQGCVLSPLLSIVCMNWLDSHSQVDKWATVGSCKISRLLLANDLVQLAPSKHGLQHALDWFVAVCDQAGMKLALKTPRNCASSESQVSVCCKQDVMHCKLRC